MPRVLIVTSMFLPYLAADAHRARLLAATLPACGWDVELLVPGDAFQLEEHFEPNADLLAVDAAIHRAEAEWSGLFRFLKSRSLGVRAYRPLRRLGDRLLSERPFDLVYFSCAQSMLFHLGIGWRRRFRVPFILDVHDPWYSPGLDGDKVGWKRRAANNIARLMERSTLEAASGLVSVSQKFLDTLNDRYRGDAWAALQPKNQAAMPFAASPADYEAAGQLSNFRSIGSPHGTCTIVYTGAGSAIMEKSFRRICRLLREVRRQQPALLSRLRIQLFGTEPHAVGRTPTLTRVIEEEEMADIISEYPPRVSYLEALRRVRDSDGLLILGVDHAAYNPSKLFLYGLSGKPILACMRHGSVVDEYFGRVPSLGRLIHFSPESQDESADDLTLMLAFLQDVLQGRTIDRSSMLAEWLAPAMARRHSDFFASCLEVCR